MIQPEGAIPLSEQARALELPSWLHPRARMRTVGAFASEHFMVQGIGASLRTQVANTRRGLIRYCEGREATHEKYAELFEYLRSGATRVEAPVIHDDQGFADTDFEEIN